MLGRVLALVARVVLWTLRVECEGGPAVGEGPARIYAFLHGRQFALLRVPRPRGMVAMVSRSRDGGLQAAVLRALGLDVVRGSSSREGTAGLRALVRRVRAGLDGAFAVDGPRGPRGRVKPGVVAAARWSGARVVPITFAATRAWVFRRAWDGYVLPWPFARVLVLAGPALEVTRDASEPELAAARGVVEAALAALTDEARDRLRARAGRAL